MASIEEHYVTDWLPGYVLDALTEEEMREVSEHLRTCASCQAELAHLQQIVDELPLAVTQTAPPPELKLKVMQSIHTRQPAQRVKPVSTTEQSPFLQRLAIFFRGRLPAFGLALIIILVLGNLLLWRQVNQANHQATTPMRVYALANTQNSPRAIGTLIMDPEGNYGTLVVDKLVVLDPSKQYQVWLIKGTDRTSGGVFSVNHDGYASLEILASLPLVKYDSIGITIEPAGGSPAPTGDKVLGGELNN